MPETDDLTTASRRFRTTRFPAAIGGRIDPSTNNFVPGGTAARENLAGLPEQPQEPAPTTFRNAPLPQQPEGPSTVGAVSDAVAKGLSFVPGWGTFVGLARTAKNAVADAPHDSVRGVIDTALLPSAEQAIENPRRAVGNIADPAGTVVGDFTGFNPSDPLGVFGTGGIFGGRVICTELKRQGRIDQALLRADIVFSGHHVPLTTMRGYWLWAIPYVRLMKRSSLATRAIMPLAVWRAEACAHALNPDAFPRSIRGNIVRVIGEPLCWLLGRGLELFERYFNHQGATT